MIPTHKRQSNFFLSSSLDEIWQKPESAKPVKKWHNNYATYKKWTSKSDMARPGSKQISWNAPTPLKLIDSNPSNIVQFLSFHVVHMTAKKTNTKKTFLAHFRFWYPNYSTLDEIFRKPASAKPVKKWHNNYATNKKWTSKSDPALPTIPHTRQTNSQKQDGISLESTSTVYPKQRKLQIWNRKTPCWKSFTPSGSWFFREQSCSSLNSVIYCLQPLSLTSRFLSLTIIRHDSK